MTLARLGPPAAVLFDWDDTLVDTWDAITHALNAVHAHFGMETVDVPEAKRRATRSLRDSFPEMFGADWEQARDIFLGDFAAHHIAGLGVKPGAEALLGTLAGAGVPMAVVSNKNGPYLRAEAEHLGWTGRFVRIVGAGDAEADKPHPAVVAMALDGLEIASRKTVWLVGDTDVDMACAEAAGCTGVMVGGEEDPAGEPRRNVAVSSLQDVQMLVSASLAAI